MRRDYFAAFSNALDALQRVLELVLAAALFLWVVYFAVSFAQAPKFASLWGIAQLHRYGDPIAGRVAAWLHLSEGAGHAVPLLLAAAAYVGIVVVDHLFARIHRALWSRAPQPQQQASKMLRADSEEAREELYRKYREIEKTLKEAQRKRCTFLSVDVAGSTSMKSGESEIAITSSFRAYEELLKRTFLATRAWKQSWTPDGVMICFLSRENAIEAAKNILEDLPAFNSGENQLKTPFQIRCGINEGEVVLFEDTNLEKVVDHVIDVAGHMQKQANLNSLTLSTDLCKQLEDQSGFAPTGRTVDGFSTVEWRAPVTAA